MNYFPKFQAGDIAQHDIQPLALILDNYSQLPVSKLQVLLCAWEQDQNSLPLANPCLASIKLKTFLILEHLNLIFHDELSNLIPWQEKPLHFELPLLSNF